MTGNDGDAPSRRRKTPSSIKFYSPPPPTVVENPCPPADPRYHAAWEKTLRECDLNHGIIRPPGFYAREFHYAPSGELWDEYWPDDDD